MWTTIVAEIIAALGPLITAALRRWLEDLLNTAAGTMTAAPDPDAHRALMLAAYERLWWFQWAKRAFLWKAVQAGIHPSPADRDSLRVLAARAA